MHKRPALRPIRRVAKIDETLARLWNAEVPHRAIALHRMMDHERRSVEFRRHDPRDRIGIERVIFGQHRDAACIIADL